LSTATASRKKTSAITTPGGSNKFVTALFDLLSPMEEALKQSGAEIPKAGASGWSGSLRRLAHPHQSLGGLLPL